MALKFYEAYNNLEDGNVPDGAMVDLDHFTDIRAKTVEALKSLGGQFMVFRNYGWGNDSLWLEISDNEDDVCEHNGEWYKEFNPQTSDIRWSGEHLKITADGSIELFSDSKDSNDKFWLELD